MNNTPETWNTGNDYTGDHYHHVIIIGKTGTSAVAYGPTANEAKANAKLIAAAPDMLRALECLVDPVSGEFWDEYKKYILSSDKKLIMKAIKKAKGL